MNAHSAVPAASRPRLILVSAVAKDRGIGLNNALPWHLPEDLAFFKKTTLGHPVLMGRATHESIGRLLPARLNLILTRDPKWQAVRGKPDNTVQNAQKPAGAAAVTTWGICHTLDEAFAAVGSQKDLFVIGGAQIYATLLPQADSLILTEIDAVFPADAYFPEWDRNAFVPTWEETHHKPATETQAAFNYRFVRYDRISPSSN